MNSRLNSTNTRMYPDPIMHNLAFGLAALTLTLITITIFYTIYKISVGDESNIQIQLPEIKVQRIKVAPHKRQII